MNRATHTAGRGNASDSFMDVNQGDKRMLRMTAAIYLSYWDPQGLAIMPQNAARLTAPILWVVGADDPMLVFNLTDQVREVIQQSLYKLLLARRSVFF